jgi:methionyl-tRNA formyltransferase
MKIIFMGTPHFALPALEQMLHSSEQEVVAVFTQPPKAQGRGLKVTYSPVHHLANQYQIPVYTPQSLRSSAVYDLINTIEADIIVVVAYGLLVPLNIIKAKQWGCLNIHPSMLPKYRGAAPIQRTIINGESISAVCIIQMDENLDTGDIICQQDLPLPPRITYSELSAICATAGSKMLLQVLKQIDSLSRTKQSIDHISYAHKLTKEEGKVNWSESAYTIDCKIRGMNPWPGVYFTHAGKMIKIITANYRLNQPVANQLANIQSVDGQTTDGQCQPGQLINDQAEVACGDGILQLMMIKPEGKAIMAAKDYLRGAYQPDRVIIFT